MKEIDNLIKEYIHDIIRVLLIVLVSIPVWMNFSLDNSRIVAESYTNYDYIGYEVLHTSRYSLSGKSDEDAYYNDTSDIVIYNNSNTEDDYTLYLVLEDNSNIDNMKISINDNINYLDDFDYSIKDGYRYYAIAKDNLVASSKNYSLYMWNDINSSYNGYITPEFAVNI